LTRALVNLAAIERNCRRLLGELQGQAGLCAVVKADGYGHGVVRCARAALAAGATCLAVASLDEARELSDEIYEHLLVMGPIPAGDLEEAVVLGVDMVIWREELVSWIEELAAEIGTRARVHVKLDTGMGRFGTRDADEASRVVAAAAASPNVDLVGVMTHFATADERENGFFDVQLERFERWARPIKQAHPEVLLHAANSAATLRDPRAHFDMVRCGIAIYGMDPFGEDPFARKLEPALELSTYVAEVKHCEVGESAGYGRHFIADSDTQLAVLPTGYGDGWRRGLSNNGDVLIDGCRRALVGRVSMDSIVVDLGADPTAERLLREEAVLIGKQGSERITAEEIAARLDTINYEVTCGLTSRVERWYHHDGER
jgi:alanine racemase